MLSTIKLFVLGANEQLQGTCSGTVVHPAGYILTNYHCVGIVPYYGLDENEVSRQPGDLYHPRGRVIIAPTRDPRDVPRPTYFAEFAAGSPDFDVAIVKIVGMFNPGEPLPAAVPLPVIARGDSDSLRIGDPIYVIGYPGIGGRRINVSAGIVSGFDDLNQDGEPDSVKHTATQAGGSSGGLGMNQSGEQIGITTFGQDDRGARISRAMMVKLAAPLIEQAVAGGGQSGPARPRGALLRAQIVDADTKRPIPDAVLIVLRPGVKPQQWDQSFFSDDLEAASGSSDAGGLIVTQPPVTRGDIHTLLIFARGYPRRVLENGLMLPLSGPAIHDLPRIELKRR
jgi:hypothetical protein